MRILEYWNIEISACHKSCIRMLFAFSVLLICSCSKRNIAPQQNTQVSIDDRKLTEATVIDYSGVDGCGFLLELANKEKLQPENISAEFKKDKLKVLVKYHITDRMTVCMAGRTIYIDYIRIKKE